MMPNEPKYQEFISLIQKSKRGKLKVYIGMSAGVGKTYRMLQEAHSLVKTGIDVKIGFVETHRRPETHQLLEHLPIIPMKEFFYKGKKIAEMDTDAIIQAHPEIVIVDELAHSNIEGSKNEKRWQDVMDILNAGIHVITAVNIQHLESLHHQVKTITQVDVKERVPNQFLTEADEIVNIDLTAEDLIERLKAGKIYTAEKIALALQNFFKTEHILQLRELALKEVASFVEKKVKSGVTHQKTGIHEHIIACISSNHQKSQKIIRVTARMAQQLSCTWSVLYVQTPEESHQHITLEKQKHLINNLNLAKSLGAEIVKLKVDAVIKGIETEISRRNATMICVGKPRTSFWGNFWKKNLLLELISLSEKQGFQIHLIPNA